ncbi:hypothetical protein ACFFUB_08730 [Algimonas porphyrae]|uniref:Uncharacterized protein n=1 Tax=Algimonas porphyrae TaxID=1128113 RepID=A0ABQ5V2Z8_9PROT|nr:hypothetical protein [Algimonas porphyrae]GLQ21903.1 hypothetical protein GCM10007854_28580 [Algimonas porphyrae]
MAEAETRTQEPYARREFLPRVFDEMVEHANKAGTFRIGKSLSWQGFQLMASAADLAELAVQALDFREPHIRPDRRDYAAFRLSLGSRLLQRDLPFTRKQLCILGDSLVMALRTELHAFPVDQVGALLRKRVEAL